LALEDSSITEARFASADDRCNRSEERKWCR
jgi:hypothetical protein